MANLASLTSFKEGDRRKIINTGSRLSHWKMLFLGGFNSMFVLNLFALVGLAPILYVAYTFIAEMFGNSAMLPFASALGTGIVTVVDIAEIQFATMQASLFTTTIIYLPLAVIVSSVLISPFVYAMRNAEYDGRVASYKDALKGFKYCGVKFFFLGIISAIFCELIAIAYYFYNNYAFATNGNWVSIVALVAIILVAIVLFVIMMFAYTLTATYKMTIGGAMKRAFMFTFNLSYQNLVIFFLTIAPLGLFFAGSFIVSLVITMYLFVGFSYMASIWMVYIQTVLNIATPQSAKKVKKG